MLDRRWIRGENAAVEKKGAVTLFIVVIWRNEDIFGIRSPLTYIIITVLISCVTWFQSDIFI